jgi:cell division protein FtsN
VIDVPLSSRVPTALLKLGELEMTRGHPAEARVYLQRLLRDYGRAAERPKATLWVVRSYFDERDVTRACTTLAATSTADMPEGELRLQARDLQQRCANEAASSAANTANDANRTGRAAGSGAKGRGGEAGENANASSSASEKRFAVQVAATETRAQAEVVVKRLAKRGVKARIDGARKPFRVRVGSYTTRAEADAAVARLKKTGQKGFVAEITP